MLVSGTAPVRMLSCIACSLIYYMMHIYYTLYLKRHYSQLKLMATTPQFIVLIRNDQIAVNSVFVV